MPPLYRYDQIVLNDKTKGDEFLKLMKKIIMPYFKKRYTQLTRVSVCNIGKQEILSDAKKEGTYIWFNTWEGKADAINDISFSGASMSDKFNQETKDILAKIDAFGKRKIINVYSPL